MKICKIKTVGLLGLCLALSGNAFANESKEGKKRPKPPKFETLDVNENGEVDFEEFSVLKFRRGDMQTIFNKIDTDGSSTITQEELKAHKKSRKGSKKHRKNHNKED
jgi:hypothetical protein